MNKSASYKEMSDFFVRLLESDDGAAVIVAFQKMAGLIDEPGKNEFFYDIDDGKLRILVSRFPGPSVRIIGPMEKEPPVFLRINTSTEKMMAVLEGRLNPVQAVMTGQVKIKGPMTFVMKNASAIVKFFSAISAAYAAWVAKKE